MKHPALQFYRLNHLKTKSSGKTYFTAQTSDLFLHNVIFSLILDKYASLVCKIDNYYSGYKVIAGIVQSFEYAHDSLKVVSIGTGSKFLYEKHLNSKGNAVHDTHAEVVARRGFIRYIYNEINQGICNSSKSIFDKSSTNNFRLKSGVKFHLYISSAPCGDARVYSHGNQSVNSVIPEGQLRKKGQSALTVTKDTSDRICNVNMSCSAKMLKWNILGIQGALLCKVIDSIYLSSIILGEKLDEKHMERALYGRIQTLLTKLPKGYHINQPKLMKVSATKVKTAVYSPNHSINWNGKSEDVEILESTSGRTIGKDKTKEYSRISRRAFFNEFNKIANKLKHTHVRYIYSEAKLSALDYQVRLIKV